MASIHISKPGKVTSAEGVEVDITPQVLAEVAETYDASKFEAQLVIGHPRMEAPSFGGIRALSFGSAGLEAEADPTDDAKDLVAKRHYKAVSASFYTPTAPNNPTPGKWHLRHVGLLGAVPPAVKGLRALSFAEGEEGVLTFGELPGYAGSVVAGMFRRIREFLISDKGQDVADKVLPDWELESLRSMSQRADEKNDEVSQGGTPALSFAEPSNAATPSQTAPQENPSMKTVEDLQAELAASQAETKRLQDAEIKRAADVRHADHVSFADGLVAAAIWPAAAKDVLVATLDHLAEPAGVVSFGEGDAAKPLHLALQEQLKTLPPNVSFSEHAIRGGSNDASPEVIAAKAVAYQEEQAAKGRKINSAEAVAHVRQAV
jgi:hypothetical protein